MKKVAICMSAMWTMIALGESALAGGLDGTAPVVCATSDTFDCEPSRRCIEDSPEAVNIPRLIRLDLSAKKAFTKGMSGEERVADIGSQAAQDGELMLQGIQNGFGWTMSIAQDSGAMALTIVGKGAGFVVFGTCTPL